MSTNRRHAVAALTSAGLLWGTTVPLSKLALPWLAPGWLTVTRFGLAAAILLAVARPRLRGTFTPKLLAYGAAGYGGSVVVQNLGIARTSVSHAALLIGAVPVLIAVIAAVWHHAVARPAAWVGFAVSLAGVGLITGSHGGGGSTLAGDGLVLASLVLSATFTVAQTRLLTGRDPVAVTAVQFLGAALGALPFAAITEGTPAAPSRLLPVLAVVGLTVGGTVLPFTLFAFGQSRVPAEVAGAFINLEPLVGATAGVVIFGNPFGPEQLAGGAAILGGLALSSLPLVGRASRKARRAESRAGDGTGRRGESRTVPSVPADQLEGGLAARPRLVEGGAGQHVGHASRDGGRAVQVRPGSRPALPAARAAAQPLHLVRDDRHAAGLRQVRHRDDDAGEARHKRRRAA
ncbi:MAG: DMT family transporter [Streptosporangiaceae bacterium]